MLCEICRMVPGELRTRREGVYIICYECHEGLRAFDFNPQYLESAAKYLRDKNGTDRPNQ